MPNSKAIKNRIKSVKSTKKITKAMELVAASKMKRAVASTLASRLYAEYSWDILTSIAKSMEEAKENIHPLFMERKKIENILLVLITSNRGLCGAYNAQVIKKTLLLLKNTDKNVNVDILTIGKKGDIAMRRIGRNIIASFFDLPDQISLANIMPISKLMLSEYTELHYDKIFITYTDFVSALTQKPNIRQILPISKTNLREFIDNLVPTSEGVGIPTESVGKKEERISYVFEGDRKKLIGTLAEKLTQMQVYQMILESNASEQSSRMIAMKNASEASGEMIDDLTLVFNKARQSNITREISEISAGMASVS